MLEGYCIYGGIADEPRALGSHQDYPDGSSSWSWNQPEEGVGFLMPVGGESGLQDRGTLLADEATMAWQVVLVGHAGDSRAWECPPTSRDACRLRFVVDRVISVNGNELGLTPEPSDQSPAMTAQEAIDSAGVEPEEVLSITLVQLAGTPYPDPRLNDLDAELVWLLTLATGAPAADGTRSLELRVVDDATANLVATLPFTPGDEVRPGRLVLLTDDQRTPSGGEWGSPRASVADSTGRTIAEGWGALNTPLVLAAGAYELSAWIANDEDSREFEETRCSATAELGELSDVYWTAGFGPAGPCHWQAVPAPY
jgi:hypothetical protein